jgi:twitching motility protein PilT
VKLLDSLLDAIVRLEGDALVMHVGEKPYVITASSSMNAYRGPLAWGQVELSSRVLTFDAVSSMLAQILPADQQNALVEYGAIEHELNPPAGIPDRFTVVAARGGEDVWVEVRRRPVEAPPVETAPVEAPVAEAPPVEAPATEAPVEAPLAAAVESPAETVVETPADAAIEAPVEVAAAPQPEATVEEPVEASVTIEETAIEAPAIDEAAIEEAASELPLEVVDVPDQIHELHDQLRDQQIDHLHDHVLYGETLPDAPADGLDSIVLALPGDATEEVVLDEVSEHAIQLIDDEPQDVPTEAEVDAMLAATATALLTSGLAMADAPDASASEAIPEAIAASIPDLLPTLVDDQAIVEETLIGPAALAEVAVVAQESSEPAFELSPPPLMMEVAEPENEELELVGVAVSGAPLFSEEAILAAAAPPETAARATTHPGHGFVEYTETRSIAAVHEPPPPAPTEISAPIALPPEPAHEPAVAAAGDDNELAAQVSVWSAALTVWTTGAPLSPDDGARVEEAAFAIRSDRDTGAEAIPATPIPEAAVDAPPAEPIQMNAVADRVADDTPPPVMPPPPAEIPMDVTPESRHDAPVAEIDRPAAAAPIAAEAATPAPPAVHVPHDRASRASDDESPAAAAAAPRLETIAAPYTPAEDAALMRTLRLAAERGAATLYVVAQSKPMIRVDGEISALEGEPALSSADVERVVMELVPPRRREALQHGPVEWLCDVPRVGRVRCLTFKDHRGPGVLFRMFPERAISAEQLGLSAEVQALSQQSDGLVLVTGARASGKSTLVNAFVDLINRTRSDHLITIETQIGFVHESRKSFISQRETRGDGELAATFARAALREDPDVLVIEDLKSPDTVGAALEAAESGRLVIASITAASTIGALERLVDIFPADKRPKARMSLATSLRGVLAQVLLRRIKGGQIPAREILLNTPAVSTLVLEGKMFQLPSALDSGRRHGMVPLTDSLATHVREGTVQVDEAYRKALDRAALLATLKREGIDTSFAERLA